MPVTSQMPTAWGKNQSWTSNARGTVGKQSLIFQSHSVGGGGVRKAGREAIRSLSSLRIPRALWGQEEHPQGWRRPRLRRFRMEGILRRWAPFSHRPFPSPSGLRLHSPCSWSEAQAGMESSLPPSSWPQGQKDTPRPEKIQKLHSPGPQAPSPVQPTPLSSGHQPLWSQHCPWLQK